MMPVALRRAIGIEISSNKLPLLAKTIIAEMLVTPLITFEYADAATNSNPSTKKLTVLAQRSRRKSPPQTLS